MSLKVLWSRRLLAVAGAVAATGALAANASAIVVHEPNGHFAGVTPRHGVPPDSIRGSLASRAHAAGLDTSGNLDYNGGPVLHSSTPYLIFWTPPSYSLPGNAEALMARYYSDVAADSGRATNVYGVIRQYFDGSGFADYRQSFSPSQVIVDTDPYPPQDLVNCPPSDTTSFYPVCLTDQQLQTEIGNLIAARGLPTGTGAGAPIYSIVTPPQVNVCMDATDCASNQFCAYHSAFEDGGSAVLYAALPFFLSSASSDPNQDPKGCQQDGNSAVQEPNGDLADVAISDLSHEDNETLTDPLGNSWHDNVFGNEVGDSCLAWGPVFDPANGQDPNAFLPTLGGSAGAGNLFDQVINNNPYYTQTEWSNGDANCQAAPAPATLSPAFNVPGPGTDRAGSQATFDPAPTNSSHPLSSATWTFDDGGRSFNPGGAARAPVSHAFAAAGRHTVTLTVVDGSGNLATASEQVVVGSPPSATFTQSSGRALIGGTVSFNAGRSTDPDPGVSLTGYTWNFGDGSSASGSAPHHAYRRAGTFTVTLHVTNSLGLTGTVSQRVTVAHGIARVKVRRVGTNATVVVTVNGPGRLSLAGKTFHLKRAGSKKVRIALTRTQRATLGAHHKVHLRLRVLFVPAHGKRESRIVTINFR